MPQVLKIKIEDVRYISDWWVVTLPLLLFLILFFGIYLGIPYIFKLPDWTYIITFIAGVVIGLAIPALIYSVLYNYAELRKVEGEISLEGEVLRWHLKKEKLINFTLPYWAKISGDVSVLGNSKNSLISIYQGTKSITLHLPGFSKDEIKQYFPAKYFIEDIAPTPYEGMSGFVLDNTKEEDRAFFIALLKVLWQKREQNTRFQVYKKYPWDRPPQPAFNYIYKLEYQKIDDLPPYQRNLLDNLEKQIIYTLPQSYLSVTPDYLLGYKYKGGILNPIHEYYIMPLGYIKIYLPIPRTDISDYNIQDVEITGRLKTGEEVSLSFSYTKLNTEKEIDEEEAFLKFIQRNSQ